jgi:peptide/nickel transport system ATP-binding protein
MPTLLSVTNLTTSFTLSGRPLPAVNGVDFTIDEGETLALVGESGCGKSMTAFSLMGLVPPPGSITGGSVLFDGEELVGMPQERLQNLRGNRLSMIFQEPMSSLNPVMTIGDQVAEGIIHHLHATPSEARDKAMDLLQRVGVPSAQTRLRNYPHQLSGGQRQRVMIAMALACSPRMVIADEPTTALDVTIQAQILDLLDQLKEEHRMGLLLITHDFGIVAEHSQQTAVMYAGRIVEQGPTYQVVTHPRHPYTVGLLASLPQRGTPGRRLATIPGSVPRLGENLSGCAFCSRCSNCIEPCRQEVPPLRQVAPGHQVRCWQT